MKLLLWRIFDPGKPRTVVSTLGLLKEDHGSHHISSRRSKEMETDSAMFQTIGWDNIQHLADSVALPLFIGETDMVAKEEGKQ